MPVSRNYRFANMTFNDIHENKLLAKISRFTVSEWCLDMNGVSSFVPVNVLNFEN